MAGLISDDIRSEIKNSLRKTITEKLNRVQPGTFSPFHQALFPQWLLLAWQFERTCSTGLGKFFEKVAKLLASNSRRYKTVETQKRIEGYISNAASSTINSIVTHLREGGIEKAVQQAVSSIGNPRKQEYIRKSPFNGLASLVAGAFRAPNGSRKTIVIDLYLEGLDGTEYYFEMKSPLPNKDQCIATTEKFLWIHAMRPQGKVVTKYAMAFNPFGDDRTTYRHSIAKKYLDLKTQVLIGQEFWDLLAGEGAYLELLDVYKEVGQELIAEFESKLQR
jgi:hypothetical protein